VTTAGAGTTAALLDALDRVREVRGSVPLFDALAAEDAPRVRDALAAWPRHPLYDRVVAWLAARDLPPPELAGPAEALARHGITDVDAWVTTRDRREAELARSLADARAERELALRSANVYALLAALLAAVAIGGWLAALGGLPLPAEPTPPTVAPPPHPADDAH
jgi:hypothetical protein